MDLGKHIAFCHLELAQLWGYVVHGVTRPRRLKGVTNSAGGPESSCSLPAAMSSVQALMDLALPRFVGLPEPLLLINDLTVLKSSSFYSLP